MYGVGVIGAGPGVSALHLPTLAALADRFRVVHISDAGSGRAAGLAAGAGARSSTGERELLADPDVDVVAVCSPPAEHARQVVAAAAAGVRAVFCEKPLALTVDEAHLAVQACREAGTVLLLGTNHLFDPAWDRAMRRLARSAAEVRAVTITLAVPPNTRYHRAVSEIVGQSGAVTRTPPDLADPRVAAGIVRQLLLGLGVHDLPGLRQLIPRIDEVVSARALPPVGYAVTARGGDAVLQMHALLLPSGADALWRVSIATDRERVDVDFPPGFVHVGSGRVRVEHADGSATEEVVEAGDGYLAQWTALADLLDGPGPVPFADDRLLQDASYALGLADAAAALAGGEER